MSFTPRTTAPTEDNAYYYADNPYYKSGYGLPNCTCYAYGRFWEICKTQPTLSLRDAENWWGHSDGYSRGSNPRLGAVACWRRGIVGDDSDGAGHVAIVEAINSDGSILTSESGYGANSTFWTTVRGGSNWGMSTSYVFQGFIYNPATEPFESLEWVAKNGYLTPSQMENNAEIIYRYFSAKGWSRNAIAAMLGNMEVESTINPGIWESLTTDPEAYYSANGRYPGFGLVQWTPYTRYRDWAGADWETDYDKQLDRIVWELENGEQYYPSSSYPETFREFSTSTKSAYYLAGAFLYNYERPKNPDADDRGTRAEKWFAFLASVPAAGRLPAWLIAILKLRM